jgi:glycosyltransferase involved in cell wall biosynthesis
MTLVSAKRRILFVEQNMDGTVGGSHFCLLDLLSNLDRDRFEPMVLFYQANPLLDRFEKLAPVLVVPPPSPVRLRGSSGAGPDRSADIATIFLQKSLNMARVSMGSAYRWQRLLARHRIDLVHLNNSIFGVSEWLIAARLSGSKCVCHQRGFPPARREPAARFLDRIVCISNQIRDDLVRLSPELKCKAVAVHDGLDTAAFLALRRRTPQQVRSEWSISDDALLIGIVGNIKEWKGQRIVVDAFATLSRAYPAARCLIVGEVSANGADREYYNLVTSAIEKHGLGDRVIITGYREDVPDLVNALDVLVHGSTEPEPMGRVILEGMALGKPVVATDHGGPQEIIESGTSGFLVPPCDPERLAERLLQLGRSPALRRQIGESAVRRVDEAFGIRQHMARIHEIYGSLWPEPTGSS